MKLYATTTSERATKGQGGNYLNINIYNENGKLSHYITVGDDILCLYENNPLTNFDGKLLLKTKIKGKKQKGDIFNRLSTSPQDVIDEYNRLK
jgi:hypothetical protein